MTHSRVKSSNLYSIAHDGESMEVRFLCQACKGTGESATTTLGMTGSSKPGKCSNCKSLGHTATYRGKVPAKIFEAVKGDKSPGAAFNRLIRSSLEFKLEKI